MLADSEAEAESAAAAEFAVELDQAAEAEQCGDVVLALECAEHAGEVAGGGDLRAKALAEGLAACVAAEVVVAARADRLGDELQLAGAGVQLDHRAGQVAEVERLVRRAAGVEIVECLLEPRQVVAPEGGRDVESVGDLAAFRGLTRAKAPITTKLTWLRLERAQELVRVERRGPVPATILPLSVPFGRLLARAPRACGRRARSGSQ